MEDVIIFEIINLMPGEYGLGEGQINPLGNLLRLTPNLTNYYTKSQVDNAITAQSAFNIIPVTQSFYTDKAINVKAFDNTGMVYSEGSIDFGITRDYPHTMGLYAFKQGFETTASGIASSAFGGGATALGEGSLASGLQTTASGDYSVAFGSDNVASGYASLASGFQTTASGNYSVTFGSHSTASEYASLASGFQTVASGNSSSAFGFQTTASGDASLAFGNHTIASSQYSSAFGSYTEANEYASMVIGRYSTNGPVETSWNSGSPIFKVGNGTNASNRSNAYVLYNDGKSTQYGVASYGADYSANFTDRSLVDKGYVDAQTVISVTQVGLGRGYRITGRNPANYGSIGYEAFDVSFSSSGTGLNGATGSYSFAAGQNSRASGSNSIAIGNGAISSNNWTISIGRGIASDESSITIGSGAATGYNSIAIDGTGTAEASGARSIAVGYESAALGENSIAFGGYAGGQNSISFGGQAIANFSIALNGYAEGSTSFAVQGGVAKGFHSVYIGEGNIDRGSQAYNSMSLGEDLIARSVSGLVVGAFNDPLLTSPEDENNLLPTAPVFIVGNGVNNANRSNAYLLRRNGRSEQLRDMEVTEIGQGVVVKSPDGTRWRITVDNTGDLTTTAL